jgi:hypothetical protein
MIFKDSAITKLRCFFVTLQTLIFIRKFIINK